MSKTATYTIFGVLAPDEELAPTLSLCRVNLAAYQFMVEGYLGASLPTLNRRHGGLALALMSGESIVGLIHYELTWRWNQDREEASLKLDLAVPSNRYKHLAKLVLRAALCREVRLMVEALHRRRVRYAVTTVFSEHPESMKYRGLFKQIRREPQDDGRYKLRYRGEFTDKSLEEHYAEWLTQNTSVHKKGYMYKFEGDELVYECTYSGDDPNRLDRRVRNAAAFALAEAVDAEMSELEQRPLNAVEVVHEWEKEMVKGLAIGINSCAGSAAAGTPEPKGGESSNLYPALK